MFAMPTNSLIRQNSPQLEMVKEKDVGDKVDGLPTALRYLPTSHPDYVAVISERDISL